ncbi:MAG: OmpA family protein [Flavobacteriales bacterium]
MLRTTILSAACLLYSALSAQDSATGKPAPATINFATASSAIDAVAQAELRAICERIAREKPERVSIIGHTDHRGSQLYNIGLSERRSEAVRAALEQCAPEVEFDLAWQGEESPLLPSGETDDVVENRRVEIAWEVAETDGAEALRPKAISPFAPLIPNAAVQFQNTTVDASEPIAWTTVEGVTVRIEGGAIVDRDGNPVNGPVDLSFRAFTDPWQTIASGIPMHIRTEKGIEHMESALMVELLATRNGEPLQLKDGERIRYELPKQMEVAPDFKTFEVDEATGEWEEAGALSGTTASSVDTSAAMSLAVQRYIDRYNYRWRDRDRDTTRFDERTELMTYCGTEACLPASRPYDRRKVRITSPYGNSIAAIRIDLLPGNQTYHLHTGFKVQLHGNRFNPEWKAFPKNMTWAYDGPLTKAELSKKFARRHYYQDVRFVHDAVTGTAMIRLKDRGTWIELPIEADLAEASLAEVGGLAVCEAAYAKALNERRAQYDHRIDMRVTAIRTEDQQHRNYAYSSANPLMTLTEADLQKPAFHDFALASHRRALANSFQYNQGNERVAATMESSGFGMCNIDRLISYDRVQEMIARFQNGSDEPFHWTSAYAISEGRNAVVTLWGNGKAEQMLGIAKGRMDWLVLSDPDGNLGLVDGRDLRGTEKVVTVAYKPIPKDLSMEDLRASVQR